MKKVYLRALVFVVMMWHVASLELSGNDGDMNASETDPQVVPTTKGSRIAKVQFHALVLVAMMWRVISRELLPEVSGHLHTAEDDQQENPTSRDPLYPRYDATNRNRQSRNKQHGSMKATLKNHVNRFNPHYNGQHWRPADEELHGNQGAA